MFFWTLLVRLVVESEFLDVELLAAVVWVAVLAAVVKALRSIMRALLILAKDSLET